VNRCASYLRRLAYSYQQVLTRQAHLFTASNGTLVSSHANYHLNGVAAYIVIPICQPMLLFVATAADQPLMSISNTALRRVWRDHGRWHDVQTPTYVHPRLPGMLSLVACAYINAWHQAARCLVAQTCASISTP
jgi:hypothetical protein